MRTATFIIDPVDGRLTVEGLDEAEVVDLLGASQQVNCARPVSGITALPEATDLDSAVRVHRIYHGSAVDGPGRRSVLQVQGCPIACAGCFVPETHAFSGGRLLAPEAILGALLAPEGEPRDGITYLGGEPMAQAAALLPLTREIKRRGIHLLSYTGYTVEHLVRKGGPAVELLGLLDTVIDGPFVKSLSSGAGEWKGSRNQRLWHREELQHALAEHGN